MNTSYNFTVTLPTKKQDRFGLKKAAFVETIISACPWLTVAGIDTPYKNILGRDIKGVDYAPAGTHLTFGTSKTHDVNWVEDLNYLKDGHNMPNYDLMTETSGALKHLAMFASNNKPTTSSNNRYSTYATCPLCGNITDVEEFASCTKIGYAIIPKAIAFPSFYSIHKPQYVTEYTITIENIFA